MRVQFYLGIIRLLLYSLGRRTNAAFVEDII